MKKKAIKIATASAIAASGFVAVAPTQSEAAPNVKAEVSRAKTVMYNAMYAYSKPFVATGEMVDQAVVYAAYKKGEAQYKYAVSVVNKYAPAKEKAALLADLDKVRKNYLLGRALNYIKAFNALELHVEKAAKELEAALATNDEAKIKEAKANLEKVYEAQKADLNKAVESSIKAHVNELAATVVETAKAAAEKKLEEIAVPKVVEVSAINAKQVEIKFNTKMDKDSVTDVTKYAIKRAGAASVALTNNNTATDADASLSEDGKTLTLTLDNALISATWGSIVEGDTFNFELGKLKAANGKEFEAQSVAVKYSDKVAPKFVSASASGKTSTTQIKVTFNEPVDTSLATATINGTAASVSVGSKPNEVIVTSGSNLLVGQTYNLSLLNVKDAAGNLVDPNPVTAAVTVAGDAVAPTVTDVKVVRDSLLEVTFDKSMDPNTISNTSIKILDANLNTTGITQGTVTAKANTDNKTFLVPVTALPFNNGTFNGVVSVANTVKDAAGNAIAATTKNVSVTEDKTAPQVVTATYKKVTSYNGISTPNGAIVVKFNEEVNPSALASTYVVVNDQGTSVATPISAIAVNPNDNTELVLTLDAAVGTGVKTYTVVMPNSAVTDKSIAGNASKSANLTVDVSAGAPVATDTTAPAVNTVTPTAATSSISGTTIAVAFTETGSGLDTATVTNVNNYRLDGAALPAGSYITVTGTTATINIPAGSFAKDKAYALNINGIKDKAGNTLTPYVGSVTLKDDIKPVFTAATLNTNGTVSLSFSEAVNTAVGKEADFAVTVNGSLLTGTNKAYTLADGVGADAGKYVLKVKKATIGVAADADNDVDIVGVGSFAATSGDVVKFEFIDVDGNQQFNAGDILISAVDTDSITAIAFSDTVTYDLNNATSLKVGTIATPTLVQDTSNLTNVVEGSKTITIK